MDILNKITSYFDAVLRISPPIILAAMAALLSFKISMMNIAVEGFMLIGAFSAVVVSYFTGSATLGVLSSCIVGAILGLIFATFNLKFKADHMITGIAINLLALGLSTYLLRTYFGVRGTFSPQELVGLPKIRFEFLNSIPILSAFNGQSIIVYLSILIVIIVHIFLYRTVWGTYVQVIGDYQPAAESAGIKVSLIKYLVLVIGGGLAGLGGAHLSLGQVTLFSENMTNGRGFISIAATIFGQRTPIGTFLASLFFSLADVLAIRLQNLNVPVFFIQATPFIVTLIILTVMGIQANQQKKNADKFSKERFNQKGN
jgi:simple sugar transport system permease protein